MSARGPELPLIQADEPGLRLPHSRMAQFWGLGTNCHPV